MGQFIDFRYVKQHADFEAVLSHYGIELEGRGKERRALCPFHDDNEPSLSVNIRKGVYNCFGCQEKGNVLEFVAEIEEFKDLRSAAVKIGEICSIDLAPPRENTKVKKGKKAQGTRDRGRRRKGNGASPPAPKDVEPAAENKPLTFDLKLNPEHEYGAERGLSPETIEEFGMGYCERGLMRGRWCIPVHDEAGELVAYAGRWVEEKPPKGMARYLLPKEFNKSQVLFNLNRIEEPEHVVLVEGYFGCVRLHELGMPVVAVMGTSISDQQIDLLKRSDTEQITLMFDGDDAGREAGVQVVAQLAEHFLVRNAVLPNREQPDTVDEVWLHQWIELLGL